VLDLLLGNRDAREMRDAADGGGVNGHGPSSNGLKLASLLGPIPTQM
jgi:hypothetical protein